MRRFGLIGEAVGYKPPKPDPMDKRQTAGGVDQDGWQWVKMGCRRCGHVGVDWHISGEWVDRRGVDQVLAAGPPAAPVPVLVPKKRNPQTWLNLND